jgi:hypothetical protein
MQIYPIDDNNRIFQVVDLLDQSTFEWVNTIDWLKVINHPFDSGVEGLSFPRRILDSTNPNVVKLSNAIKSKLSTINNLIETSLTDINVVLWLDSPGFKMTVHTDKGIEKAGILATLQLYLFAPNEDYGTELFTATATKYKTIFDSYYKFKSVPNTGYIMLNHLNEDGSLPMLWHGMLNRVPEDCYRLSAYWYLK